MTGVAPPNTNLVQPSKFTLGFDRLPYLTYFVTKVNIPGITSGNATQVTPFIDAPVPGDKLVYANFEATFLVDELLYTWTTILDWIKGITFPENFDQYKNLSLQQKLQISTINHQPQYSDAILTVLSNKNNPTLHVKIYQMFPVSLGDIQFDTSKAATDVVTATATFKFTNYEILRP